MKHRILLLFLLFLSSVLGADYRDIDPLGVVKAYMESRYHPFELRLKKISVMEIKGEKETINEIYVRVIWKRAGTRPFKKYIMVRIEKRDDGKETFSIWEKRKFRIPDTTNVKEKR